MNIFAVILAALQATFGSKVQSVLAAIPAFFVSGIVTLAVDEVELIAKALDKLLSDISSGKGWEVALTDCYNVFYSGELSEGHKLSMAFLEWLAKTVSSI